MWFPLAGIVLILFLIARFYARFSGRRTYYWLYLVPLVTFGAVAVRSAGADRPYGDLLIVIASITGGITLLALVVLLYIRMIVTSQMR